MFDALKAFSPKRGLIFAVKGASTPPPTPKFPVDTLGPPPPLLPVIFSKTPTGGAGGAGGVYGELGGGPFYRENEPPFRRKRLFVGVCESRPPKILQMFHISAFKFHPTCSQPTSAGLATPTQVCNTWLKENYSRTSMTFQNICCRTFPLKTRCFSLRRTEERRNRNNIDTEFQYRPRKPHGLANQAELSPKWKLIRNCSTDPTSSINTSIADTVFADAVSETPIICLITQLAKNVGSQ